MSAVLSFCLISCMFFPSFQPVILNAHTGTDVNHNQHCVGNKHCMKPVHVAVHYQLLVCVGEVQLIQRES